MSKGARGFSQTIGILLFAASAAAQPNFPTAIPQTKFNSGQDVVPYFEGWIRNRDGTFDMVFGYFNRNWQEELAIPPGLDNAVMLPGDRGGVDHGQPTYFLPRRQGWSYRVRVPAAFGKQEVTWTIVANGKKEVAYGTLDPVEEISERIIMTRGNLNPGEDDPNKPPEISIAPVTGARAATSVTLTALVTDDGLPKPRESVARPTDVASTANATRQANSNAGPRTRGLNVSWMEVRGPAKVTFPKASGIAVVDGTATASATFAEPGTYVLRATATDGALATKADVTVEVAASMPIVDNERVTVWDVTAADPAAPKHAGDTMWISLSRPGDVAFKSAGQAFDPSTLGGRAIAIDLKDHPVPPLSNTTGYPNAFPRPGVKKLFENGRVVVWDYTWQKGVATPMHFHDKDVVVVYVENGALKSTTADGQSTMNEFEKGTVRYNTRNRVHTELLTTEKARAIITELK